MQYLKISLAQKFNYIGRFYTYFMLLLAVAAIFIALKFVKKDAHKMDDEGGQA